LKSNREENEIRALLARMSMLANSRDVDGLMALHDSNESAFLFGKQLTHEGNRRHCAQGYAALRGDFTYEFVPLKIETGADAAFAFGEERTEGATQAGPFATTINATYCLRKISGRWVITHQHLSLKTQEST
jgi:ketosteroid isomerase-like protein